VKIKVDENLPSRLIVGLRGLGHDVETVAAEGLTGHSDHEVWLAARREQRFFITQDLDFSDSRRYRPGTHPGLLLVRLREPGAVALAAKVLESMKTTPIEALAGCYAVLTDNKLRIKRR
jgi:predicted nuclease of predicted toxin-antitoxin system